MMVTVVTAVIVIPVMLMTFIVEDFAGRAVDLVFIFMLGRAKFKFVAVYTVVAVLLGGGEDYIRGGKPAVLKCDKLCILNSNIYAGICRGGTSLSSVGFFFDDFAAYGIYFVFVFTVRGVKFDIENILAVVSVEDCLGEGSICCLHTGISQSDVLDLSLIHI